MLIIIIFGLIIGSFLNVCIFRVPNKQSILYPPSHCPKCDTKLKPVDLIPVLSYLFRKGKCKYCGCSISKQYIIVELLNGVIYLLLYLKFYFTIDFIKYAVLISLLIVISFIDYYHKIIPDKLIIFGFIIGLGANILCDFKYNFFDGIIGLLIGGGIFFLIAVVTKGAMGGGDIKLMGMLGFWLGYKAILFITFLSFVIGAIISIILILFKIKERKDYIPFAPFISIATFIMILYGTQILEWYIKIIMS